MRIHTYSQCDTCRKATKWLKARGLSFIEIPIRDQPPTKEELERMLVACGGELRRLFNTSGLDYRALGLKDRLPSMSRAEAIELLAGSGNLIRRPFFLMDGSRGLIGFKPEEWEKFFA